jgi:hypothetical protein
MSQMEEFEELTEEEPRPIDGSLRARMQQRAEQLEKVTTEIFPLPGWDDLLEVELRVSGLRQATRVQKRNERVRDPGTQNLYNMCDLLLAATVGFWQVIGEDKRKPLEASWESLAKNLDGCPDAPTARQAMIFLLKEHRIPRLYAEWEQWMTSAAPEVDKELAEDFGTTG